tara:strand:+ start:13076 stop:13648 length:573 start_codon:yes stop_codon:yes gene_type:complete
MRAEDPEAVVRALRLRTVLPANWASGLAQAATEGVFVTPPVDGWILVFGRDLAVTTHNPAEMEALLTGLSEQYGEVMWFSTDEVRDVHGWAMAERGQFLRGYAYDEGQGHTLWHGDVTAAETALGCFLDDPRDQSDDEIKWWPDRRTVLAIAAAWSMDPTKIGSEATRGANGGDRSGVRSGASAGLLGRL